MLLPSWILVVAPPAALPLAVVALAVIVGFVCAAVLSLALDRGETDRRHHPR